MGQSQNPPNRKCDGVHFFHDRIYHAKVTSEPHCVSCTDIDMGKTISTFFVLLFDFIHHIFFPEAFHLRVKKICTQFSGAY